MLNLKTMSTKKVKKNPAVDEYIASLDTSRSSVVGQLRETIINSLPAGFEEHMTSMPNYVVPLKTYPSGYHVSADTPLPYISFASQKNFVALYHFGIYVDSELMEWFVQEYPKHMSTKLDMGKSCIRFKKPDQMPFELIRELLRKRSVQEWIAAYEKAIGRS